MRRAARLRTALPAGFLLLAIVALPAAAGVPADDEVAALLDAAEAAERREHLIYPARGSAMSLYHDVLQLDPDNDHARAGLTRLAEHYLVAAQEALQKDQLLKAESLVSRAKLIYPDYPAVATLSGQIRLLRNAERTRKTLDWRLVAERSERLTPSLKALGRQAKNGDCRVAIQVSSDAEGRWVYRQMNQAEGDGRLRAEVRIASPAAVDIVCFVKETDEKAH